MEKKDIDNNISFIIPNYNTPIKDLKRCLDSIYSQDKNCEVIVVDDFSKNINAVEKLCSTYSNIKLIKNSKNLGVSTSRNKAIKKAKGSWISFVDADDEIMSGSIAKIKGKINALSSESDIIVCGVRIVTKESFNDEYYYDNQSIATLRKEVLKQKTTIKGATRHIGVTWGKLYRKTFLISSNILFPENIKRAEDNIFFLDILSKKPTISKTDIVFYKYIDNSYSVTKRFNPNLFEQFDETLAELEKRIHGREEKTLVQLRRSKYVLNAINNLLRKENKSSRKEIIRTIAKIAERKDNRASLILDYNDKSNSIKKRLVLFLIINKMYFLLFVFKRSKR